MKQFLYILLIGCGFLFGTACSNDDSDDVLEKVQNAIDTADADDEPAQPEASTRSYKNIVTLQLKTSGTLKALLGDSLTTADKLILSGPIDADDVSTFLNDMPALVGLDLTNATMVESEKTFYNKAYSSGTKLYLKKNAIVERMFSNQKFVEIKLPQGITNIEKNAFYNSKVLTTIEIPQKVEVVNESAFYSCEALSAITLPDSLTAIGQYSFKNCSALKKIELPEKVNYIGQEAFYSSGLSSISLSDSLETIGQGAFRATSLTKIEIPDKVQLIPVKCFYECTSLANISLPAGIKTISYNAFRNTAITNVDFLGNNIESIEEYAFEECRLLKTATLPNSVMELGKNLFHYCI